ncbi:hypothetical protein SAMN02745216_03000 [Desulfatibacillum alkenivorans DSM 16219]|jgi:hypothetical protein|uniref:Uncharacterized protein n=1 Tax=Desulfatibacillum alkenivorans DSM 16219 TaxID=1121393 RepID=A0A1M6Q8T2_9BACT|nr:hypothetical protein [Desulfatibacillum alkenivorans]SHK16704.1 hypothetical protein SAMN02745216_03000 [Desulfatibacillum alkenivorans DSM 16219]
MERHTIQIDDIIMNYLKEQAEPFVDTPNTVLHRLLFGTTTSERGSSIKSRTLPGSVPKALAQILEVIHEIVVGGATRPKATRIVAIRNKTDPQTIMDKYCRQLGKKANEIDMLLEESDLYGLRKVLLDKFQSHKETVNAFFNQLQQGGNEMDQLTQQLEEDKPQTIPHSSYRSKAQRKQRDPALESALKRALGKSLQSQFGGFVVRGQSHLVFNDAQVLCKYSSAHTEQARMKWFWGVSKSYWENWESNDYLALIMENEDCASYSYLFLNADEAKSLLRKCSVDGKGEKKINLKIYADDEIARFQEWQVFDVENRRQPLGIE